MQCTKTDAQRQEARQEDGSDRIVSTHEKGVDQSEEDCTDVNDIRTGGIEADSSSRSASNGTSWIGIITCRRGVPGSTFAFAACSRHEITNRRANIRGDYQARGTDGLVDGEFFRKWQHARVTKVREHRKVD